MNIIRTILLFLLLQGLVWATHDQELSAKQQYDEGMAAVERDDYKAALAAWLPLAEQGNARMQFIVGSFYDIGKGDIPQDFNKAEYWYRKAALQNYSTAQYNLGVMYGHGQGMPEDDAQAYMWFNVAIANGPGPMIIRTRDEFAQYMTPAQLSEGQRLTREWLEKHPPTPPDPSCIPH
jgi:TPR repeat protein